MYSFIFIELGRVFFNTVKNNFYEIYTIFVPYEIVRFLRDIGELVEDRYKFQ